MISMVMVKNAKTKKKNKTEQTGKSDIEKAVIFEK
jgi:hypothetical protein